MATGVRQPRRVPSEPSLPVDSEVVERLYPHEWYDRSSLDGDFLVTIEGQSPEDWERLAPEMRFCEYINGLVYMPSPVSDRHQEITGLLYQLLDGFRWAGRCGQVLTGPAVLRLSGLRKPEPNILVRPTPEQAGEGGASRDVKAVFVVEVLSPSNRGHDLDCKARIYRDAGIPKIWYIDEQSNTLTVDRRGSNGYARSTHSTDTLDCPSIPGFWIDVSWLWSVPLSNPRRCLEAILAAQPPDS